MAELTIPELTEACREAFGDLRSQVQQLRNELHKLRAEVADAQSTIDGIEPRLVAVELR